VARIGSLLTLFLRPLPPESFAQAKECDSALFARFHRGMLERGVMLPPSQFEAWFVSAAHDEAAIDTTVRAAHDALRVAVEAQA
jgi:glutamate-1-semialdehyde 2,1-aminomutase